MDPLAQARNYYRQKDYKAALEVLTEVISVSTNYIQLTALDQRAATYEKLGELQSALKDARNMIILKPERAKGYLRCGKVLQLSGKAVLALQIYERGLSKVKIGEDTDRLLLQRMYAKLQQRQEQLKNLDPLMVLPIELAHKVYSYLNMRDRVICLAVSKTWKRFLESSHDLWTTLDFRRSRVVSKNSLKACLRRSNFGAEHAFLNVSSLAGTLEMITRSCKSLKYLHCINTGYDNAIGATLLSALAHAKNLRSLIIKDCAIMFSQVAKALLVCPLLERAEFHLISASHGMIANQWPEHRNLTALVLKYDIGSTFIRTLNVESLLKNTPNLRYANLSTRHHGQSWPLFTDRADFARWTHLEYLNFSRARLNQVLTLPPTLKHLYLSDVFEPLDFPEPREFDLPLLETFVNTRNSGGIGFDLTVRIIAASLEAGNLKTLHMCDLYHYSPLCSMSMELQTFTSDDIIELSLCGWQMPEDQLCAFLRGFPNLMYLDLSSTFVTGVAVRELMTRAAGPLIWLSVNDCRMLSPDAVDYARGLGCVVEYRVTSLNSNSRVTGMASEVRSIRDRIATHGLRTAGIMGGGAEEFSALR